MWQSRMIKAAVYKWGFNKQYAAKNKLIIAVTCLSMFKDNRKLVTITT